MKAGDVVEIEAEGIGVLQNPNRRGRRTIMTGKTIRIGVIGCGFYAQNHLNAWRDLTPLWRCAHRRLRCRSRQGKGCQRNVRRALVHRREEDAVSRKSSTRSTS